MKKKILLILITIISFFTFCNNAFALDMDIEEVKVLEKSDNVEYSDIKLNDENQIKSDIVLNKKDDYIILNIKIKNKENAKYTIESIRDNIDNNYISLVEESDLKEINGKSNFNLKVKITYDKKLVNADSLNIDNLEIIVSLIKEDGSKEEIVIVNPTTGDHLFKFVLLLIFSILGLLLIRKSIKNSNKKYGILIIILMVFILPLFALANEKYELKLKIDGITYKGEFETYNISFDLDNGSEPVIKEVTYGNRINELPEEPTKIGYEFDKWIDDDGNEVTEDTIIKKKINVKAKYNIVEYSINYDYDGGTLDNGITNPSKYTIETDTFTLISPKKPEYTFTGWKENNVIKDVITIEKGSTGERNLKAIYEKIELDFVNQNIELIYSLDDQEKDIVGPTNGSGNYVYREISEKDSDNNDTDYIRLDNNKIIFDGNMPAGGYSYIIEVEDIETGAKQQALYTIIINKKSPKLILDNNEISVDYNGEGIINFTYDGDGEIICESNDDVVLCEVDKDNNRIIINPKGTPGSESITVKGINGTNYSDITKTITVNIKDEDKPKELSITSTNDLSETQTITLSCKDDVGVTGYYFGTTRPNENTTFDEITKIKNMQSAVIIGTEGDYYFACKDESNNISDIITQSFYKTSLEVEHGSLPTDRVLTMNANKITLPVPTPENKYSMIGSWYTNSDYTGDVLEYGSEYEPNSSSSLYTYGFLDTFTVTYDYLTNGGTESSLQTRDYKSGSKVSLSVIASSNNEVFIGWNTDKDAKTALSEFIMPRNDVTLYAIFGRAKFIPGDDFHNKMAIIMRMGGGDVEDGCIPDTSHTCQLTFNNFLRSSTITSQYKTEDYLVSSEDSEIPIYLWYDSTNGINTYFWYSEDATPYLNEDSSWMFSSVHAYDEDLKLDLSSFDTSKVENMSYMFAGTDIKTLDLSTFDTKNVTNMYRTFLFNVDLTTIYVSDKFVTDNVTNSTEMFKNSPNIVGEQGTTYSDEHTDKEYAHVDGGLDNPGYFTKRTHSIFKTGKEVNLFIKKLSNGSKSKYYDFDNKTKYFRRSSTIPSEYKNDNYIVSLKISNYPIYMWLNEDTIYWYCESEKVDFNNDSSYFFSRMWYLKSISDLDQMDTSNVTNMSAMFADCQSLESIDLSSFNTKHVINMQSMFFDCRSLTSIDLSPLDTSNVISMSDMFADCQNMESIDLSPLDTSKVTNMSSIFAGCTSLKSIDLSPLDTSNAINMSYMFADCQNLESIDLTPLESNKLTKMNGMFAGCTNLTSIDLTPLNTSNVVSMRSLFSGSNNLVSINFDNIVTSNVTDMSGMFANCTSLSELDLSRFDTNKVTNMGTSRGSGGCGSAYTYETCEYEQKYKGMFQNTTNLETIYSSKKFNVENVTNSSNMFSGDTKLVGGAGTIYSHDHHNKEYAGIDEGESNPGYFSTKPALLAVGTDVNSKIKNLTNNNLASIKQIIFSSTLDIDTTSLDNNSNNVISSGNSVYPVYAWYDNEILYLYSEAFIISLNSDSSNLFYGMSGLEEVNFDRFDSSNVISMRRMFEGCSSLTSLDFSNLDTSNVTDMSGIFNSCSSLSYLDMTGFDFSKTNHNSIFTSLNIKTLILDNVKFQSDMSIEFAGMRNLTTLSLNNVDTSNVTNMNNIFSSCSNLAELDLSSFDTSNVTDMSNMFSGMTKLKSVNLSSFNTSNVTKMSYLFAGCSSLLELDLSSFNTSNVTNMEGMFYGCYGLTKLDISNFNFTKVGNITIFPNACPNIIEINAKNVIFPANSSNAFVTLRNLKSINLENADTSNVTNMSNMFNYCSSLEELDLSSFNTSNVTNMEGMFNVCNSLKTIYVSNNFIVPNSLMNMFGGIDNSILTGGAGTTLGRIKEIDPENWNKSKYAIIDGGEDNPGYFTYKEPENSLGASISKLVDKIKNSKYGVYVLVISLILLLGLYVALQKLKKKINK